ncbi:MAG: glucoamylase family protein [Candidatus Sulfotelmatobacter sp.]
MVPNADAETVMTNEVVKPLAIEHASESETPRHATLRFASTLAWLPGTTSSDSFSRRCHKIEMAFSPIFAVAGASSASSSSSGLSAIRDNLQLITSELRSVPVELSARKTLVHVRKGNGKVVPRILAFAEGFWDQHANSFDRAEFEAFCMVFQEVAVFDLYEVLSLVPALKLVLLERIAVRGRAALADFAEDDSDSDLRNSDPHGLETCIRSLRDVAQTSWSEVLEPLILLDGVLRRDPAGAYARMDIESRAVYREKLSKIAKRSDMTEMEVANEVLGLAQRAESKNYQDPRIRRRESHVGYYLVSEGTAQLHERVGFKPDPIQTLRVWLLRHPDEFFLPGIVVLTFAIITVILLTLTSTAYSPMLVLLSMLILLLPSSQAAIQVMNYLVTTLLPAEILPKLDFSEGIPSDCVAMVAVPTLLLNEQQVRGLVENLEVRYLGNHDPNMHFALVSDLPDSDHLADEKHHLIDLASSLIQQLNEQYGAQKTGSFFLFHRHRVYNPREKGWMGWERKRGKLLDLNKLLRAEYDSFPVKVGDLSILPQVRFVITLDSDTELPRGSAHRMVGTLAHPLHQAIIDPEKNIVVAGYGILQPRVGVSVQSTGRSRLAAIYAGETGFDIYTRAVSDAYQDLYGEGSFSGKGIYEVDTVQQVLNRRFPRNALLSHDLIEGAYARAGLVSDIELIEDYPSHYSAYNRRKHRWMRGDWQIVEWLTDRVPEESGARILNPISLVSRWKILDNLRRSLVEPATLLLLIFGWLLPEANHLYWTLATVCILFIPPLFELASGMVRAALERNSLMARDVLSGFYATTVNVLLTVVFLAHQTLLSLDAVVRTLIRRMVTHERLLEWETAEESEMGARRTPVDRYLDWMPATAAGIGLLLLFFQPKSLLTAMPFMILWACSKFVAVWLNQSPTEPAMELSSLDVHFLRRSALHTWRYFAEFCTEEHNWLIPDNVQEEPPAIAPRISPTNVGFLLNARQVAVEFGYLTVPEMAELTRLTLGTVSKLAKHRGHLLNWYDTRTLSPLLPAFVSSVDSGNLVASLWTLQHGCLDRLERPLFERSLADGFLDYLRGLADRKLLPRKTFAGYEAALQGKDWLASLMSIPENFLDQSATAADQKKPEVEWLRLQAHARLRCVQQMVRSYAPWFLPELAMLQDDPAVKTSLMREVPLLEYPELISKFQAYVDGVIRSTSEENRSFYERLRTLLAEARTNATALIDNLRQLAALAGSLANEMDFAFLLNSERKLLTIGFDTGMQQMQPACYDLLASEARIAVFSAIAKEDIEQECWFRMGRAQTLDGGRPVLLSWSGTMFEYLMPGLWMRSYPNTLLDRARVGAVKSQQAYALTRGVPWGISESAFFKIDEAGNYQYQAFGLPQLSMMRRDSNPLVISPYSTFLSLEVDRPAALRNLRRMGALKWFGPYGFYEAADYSSSHRLRPTSCELVRCWMAHHQGMSLLSLANVLCDGVVHRWFHSDRRVQATELVLHEKPAAHVCRVPSYGRTAA